MSKNLGTTRLKRPPRRGHAMQAFDRLPRDLRHWLHGASLPWSARSAQRAYDRACKRCRDRDEALRELDALQARLIARDAAQVWGDGHPAADR